MLPIHEMLVMTHEVKMLAIATAIVVSVNSPALAQTKHALTVGVETYDPGMFQNLDYAEDDAIRIGLALKRTGYKTDIMVSTAESARMRPTLASNIWKALQAKVEVCGPADTLVVSLSGHGVQFKDDQPLPSGVKETYFCPETADLGDKSTLVPISKVMDLVSRCEAKQKLLLIDSCRDSVISETGRSKSSARRIELQTVHESRRSVPGGMAVLFSCQSEEVSWEAKDLGHSVFSHFVGEYLDGNADDRYYDGRNLILDGLVFYVRKKTNDYVFEKNLSSRGQYPVSHGAGANWSLGKPPSLMFEIGRSTPDVRRMESEDYEIWNRLRELEKAGKPKDAVLEQQRSELRKRIDAAIESYEPESLAWTAEIGTSMYTSPVVEQGRIFVPTNAVGRHEEDLGVLMCLNETDGELVWELLCPKLATGRVHDWPQQGIYSRPAVEQDRLWVLTNRCELVCLDIDGFRDGENDGPFQRESNVGETGADIIWSLDFMSELNVSPHNKAVSDPVVFGDLVIVSTSNGVDESHVALPSPDAPSVVAANRHTGDVVWTWKPEHLIRHGSWSSPVLAQVNGITQVIYGCGDGWLYGLDASSGERIWKADLNPKDVGFAVGGQGDWTSIIARPLVFEDSVIIGTGDDPEHGTGVASLWRIGLTKTGDVGAELGEFGTKGRPNPNSAVVWQRRGELTFDERHAVRPFINAGNGFDRTLSTPVLHENCLFTACLDGVLLCIDLDTGEDNWAFDMLSSVWSSPVLINGQVIIGNEEGYVTVFDASKYPAPPMEFDLFQSIYATPVVTDDAVYIGTSRQLYKFLR